MTWMCSYWSVDISKVVVKYRREGRTATESTLVEAVDVWVYWWWSSWCGSLTFPEQNQ